MSNGPGVIDPDEEWQIGPEVRLTFVGQPLGAGGMARVELARVQGLNDCPSPVAVKVLTQAGRLKLEQIFIETAECLRGLRHPNLVRVHHAVGRDESRGSGLRANPLIVMEYVTGGSIHDWIVRAGPFEVRVALALVAQVLDGLGALHQAGWIHCDLKAANVLLRDSESPVLIDFEGACQPGAVPVHALRTPGWTAPEREAAPAQAVTPAIDIYGSGALLYWCLRGVDPIHLFAAEARAQRLEGVPAQVRGLLDRLCAYRPVDRPATADEAATEVREVIAQLGAEPAPTLFAGVPEPRVAAETFRVSASTSRS